MHDQPSLGDIVKAKSKFGHDQMQNTIYLSTPFKLYQYKYYFEVWSYMFMLVNSS